MKKLVPLFALSLLFLTLPAAAQLRWGVRAGVTDGEPMIGGEIVYPLPAGFVLNPNLEFSQELFSANADVHYDFALTKAQFWVGAGLAFVNPDEGDFDGGFNLLAGLGTQRGSWYPYAQVKYTSAGDIDDYGSLAVGVRF